MYQIAYRFDAMPQAPKRVTRADILTLQQTMLEANDGAANIDICPLTHHFAPQVYGREILIPAGTCIVGKIHRHAHLNVILAGRCYVATEGGRKELKAGDVFVSEPGIKRAVVAVEDTRWITIHPNSSGTQDLAEIEDYVIVPSFEALAAEQQQEVIA